MTRYEVEYKSNDRGTIARDTVEADTPEELGRKLTEGGNPPWLWCDITDEAGRESAILQDGRAV